MNRILELFGDVEAVGGTVFGYNINCDRNRCIPQMYQLLAMSHITNSVAHLPYSLLNHRFEAENRGFGEELIERDPSRLVDFMQLCSKHCQLSAAGPGCKKTDVDSQLNGVPNICVCWGSLSRLAPKAYRVL